MEKNNLSKFKKSFKRRVKISSFNAKKLSKNIKKSTKNFVFMNWTWPKKVFLGIIIIVLIGTILLYLPISYNYTSYEYRNNEYIFHLNLSEADKLLGKSEVIHVNFIKAMFVAVSAFTDTGLTAGIEVGTHMNFFGQFVVYSLIQVGGFGYISLFYLLGKVNLFIDWLRKISLVNRCFTLKEAGQKFLNHQRWLLDCFLFLQEFNLSPL